jgi:hypothetical protein
MTSVADWRDQFAVWGRYLDVQLDGRRWALRSHLEIFEHGLDVVGEHSARPDLVAVMMNPGGSRPLAEPDAAGWSPAQPDRTQHQLMRLARTVAGKGAPIRHIRVINLSDLRATRSADLFAWLDQLRDGRHSLFDPRRADELAAALGPAETPVLRAWGLSKALAPLAARALDATGGHPILGIPGPGMGYRHPLPQRADLQRQWLQDILSQWAAVGSSAGQPVTR